MVQLWVSLVDVVDGRRFWRADRFAPAALLSRSRKIDREDIPEIVSLFVLLFHCGVDCFCWLVSRTGQNVSTRLSVSALFAVGGFEIRSGIVTSAIVLYGRARPLGGRA